MTHKVGGEPPRTQAPAGWYPDPSSASVQRYWDGTQWTAHTAQLASVAPRSSTGTRTTLVVVGIAVGALLLLSLVAAVAIPVFHNQRAQAHDAAARADLAEILVAVQSYWVDHPAGPAPTLTGEPGSVVIAGPSGTVQTISLSPQSTLGRSWLHSPDHWCVTVLVSGGNAPSFYADPEVPSAPGACP